METKICSHYPKNLDKEKLSKALQNFEEIQCCSKIHEKDKNIKQAVLEEMWTCLTCLRTYCGRNSDGKCMIKHNEVEGHEVVLSYKKNQIWCYECDDAAQTIIQSAKLFNENIQED